MDRVTARRRWLVTIIALVGAGCVAQIAVMTTMIYLGARSGGDQWLHNDSDASIERLNHEIIAQLQRTVTAMAVDNERFVRGVAVGDRALEEGELRESLDGGDPDEHYLLLVDGARAAGSSPCDAELAVAPPGAAAHGYVSCAGAPFFAAQARVSPHAVLWLLRSLGERYVDAVSDVTLCEVEVLSAGAIVSSAKAIDGGRLAVPLALASAESGGTVRVHFDAPYEGVPAGTVAPEDWPLRGETSFSMLVNTRPLGEGSGATLATMIPLDILLDNLKLAVVALLVVGVVLMALLAFVADRLIRRYTRPLKNLEEAAHAIAGGTLGTRVVVEGDREVAGLAMSFNTMIDQLLTSRTQLLQQEKLAAIGQLAAGIAHEINTPIQYVGDNIAFLEGAFAHVEQSLQQYRGMIADDVSAARVRKEQRLDFYESEMPTAFAQATDGLRRVASIVMAMRDFSHASKGKMDPVSLHDLIETTATISKNEWKYVADLDVDVDAALPRIPALRDELSQALLNIIVNAAHAIEARYAGSGTRGHIHISARRRGDHAELCVSDDGTGMTSDVQKRIFEPFFTTKPVGKGTGQGLAIAYAVIVEKHHGHIGVESAPNRGTLFTIDLPLVSAEPPAEVEVAA